MSPNWMEEDCRCDAAEEVPTFSYVISGLASEEAIESDNHDILKSAGSCEFNGDGLT